jgi:hypothetical protein
VAPTPVFAVSVTSIRAYLHQEQRFITEIIEPKARQILSHLDCGAPQTSNYDVCAARGMRVYLSRNGSAAVLAGSLPRAQVLATRSENQQPPGAGQNQTDIGDIERGNAQQV